MKLSATTWMLFKDLRSICKLNRITNLNCFALLFWSELDISTEGSLS